MVGAGVDVFGNVTGVAVATKGAGVTVGIPAMAVAMRSFTICSTSSTDGPKEQATAAAEMRTPEEGASALYKYDSYEK